MLPTRWKYLSSQTKLRASSIHHSKLQNEFKIVFGAKDKNGPEAVEYGFIFSSDEYIYMKVAVWHRLLANIALAFYNEEVGGVNFELVKTGIYSINTCSKVFLEHFNFEAKDKNVPDAPVNRLFAEIIRKGSIMRIHICECLGPIDKLPEYADTHGCLFCNPGIIYHPASGRFCWGDIALVIGPESSNPWLSFPLDEDVNMKHEDRLFKLATLALKSYNEVGGENFQLVKMGFHRGTTSSVGYIQHFNFEAKNEKDPTVPVNTFFAEFIRRGNDDELYIFVSLGPTDELPKYADSCGCLCCEPGVIHHDLMFSGRVQGLDACAQV